MTDKRDSLNSLKINCISQTRNFFQSKPDFAEQVIRIIEQDFDTKMDLVFQVTDTIKKNKNSRFHTRISALFFSHLLVFSNENSKLYSNKYSDLNNYTNFIIFTFREDNKNFNLISDTAEYCRAYSKKIGDFPLTSQFDVNYTLYVHDNMKTNSIINKQDAYIDRLGNQLNDLEVECSRLRYIIQSKDIQISEQNFTARSILNETIIYNYYLIINYFFLIASKILYVFCFSYVHYINLLKMYHNYNMNKNI